jgi:hypothetical protein
MTDPDPNPFADCDGVVCYGRAKPTSAWPQRRTLERSSVKANRSKAYIAIPCCLHPRDEPPKLKLGGQLLHDTPE